MANELRVSLVFEVKTFLLKLDLVGRFRVHFDREHGPLPTVMLSLYIDTQGDILGNSFEIKVAVLIRVSD